MMLMLKKNKKKTKKNVMEQKKEKKCSKCGKIRSYGDFYSDKRASDGLSSSCCECAKLWREQNKETLRKKRKKYYQKNKEKMLAANKEWAKSNSGKMDEYRKKWAEKNKDKIKERRKKNYEENKVAILAVNALWVKNNKDRKTAIDRAYREKNATLLREKKKKYRQENKDKRRKWKKLMYATNPRYRVCNSIGGRIRSTLKKGAKRGRRWEDLVGYSIDDIKRHLEKQFKPGMSWDNYGEWHIDHIIPISVFNFESPEHEDFKRCWALKNLRPMWAADNIRKSNKLKKHFQPRLALNA